MSSDKQLEPHRYAYIDALRGYAILGVIIVHTAVCVPRLSSPLVALAASGQYGVQLFFVASALTLLLSWHARSDGMYPFYVRRLFRIAPMFWLAIPLYFRFDGVSIRHWAPSGISWWHLAVTVPFLHGWHPESINTVVPGGWSIAVETTFYALFPALVVAIRSWTQLGLALGIAIGAAAYLNPGVESMLAVIRPEVPPYLASEFVRMWFFNQLPVFLIGFAVYFALRDIRIPLGWAWAGLILSLVAIGMLPFVALPGPPHLKYALCFGLLAFCLGQGAGDRWLVNDAVRQLGKVSYSAYLWHFAVLNLLTRLFRWTTAWLWGLEIDSISNPWLVFVAMLAAAICITAALSSLTYRFVEQPMIAIGNRIARHWQTLPAIPAPQLAIPAQLAIEPRKAAG